MSQNSRESSAGVVKVTMLCSLCEFWEHTTELSLFLSFGPCAECDSAVTRANVLKTHNESKLAEIKRCAMRACLPGVDGCGSPLSPVAVSSSAVVHSPCAECDSSVTRVNVLKTHNESRLAKIRRCAVHACLPGVGRFWPCTESWSG